ncbi:MAG: CDP-alcohol phosphatidyltransferase family protein [Marmoricola sp.]
MRTVQTGPMIGLMTQLLLLFALAVTVGLSGVGVLVGTAAALVTCLLLSRALVRDDAPRLGPANRVTLARAMLVCAVGALIASSFSRPAAVPTVVAITALALALDAVDGMVARRTGSVSSLGARFDMEVDAFLILVLSVYVARSAGSWVLAIGAARYWFVAARLLLPWMRGTVPPRPWCKVVAAVQGVVLTLVATDLLPDLVEIALLVAALALLAESFGREVWWLARHRTVAPAMHPLPWAELGAVGIRADG